VQQQRDLSVEWRLFSLQLINADKEDPLADLHTKGTPALRTLALVRRQAGNDAVGRIYQALGTRVHDEDEELTSQAVEKALEDAGFDSTLVQSALEDEGTMDEVRTEHEAAVNDVGAFGVPTIVTESGKGLFGPVLSSPPEGDAAGELWDHVRWLIEQDGFFELKRERDRKPGE
jgi:predicted DsbA family dithiol-disulfide isomerase